MSTFTMPLVGIRQAVEVVVEIVGKTPSGRTILKKALYCTGVCGQHVGE